MQEPEDLPERDSKTLRKKQMLALQKLGELLVLLPAAQLEKVPLTTTLSDAIIEARGLKSHEAKRRQLQYIGKLMRHIDVIPIEEAVSQILRRDHLSKAKFHQIERWRDQLIEGGDEIMQDFANKYPATDNQQLRQLIRNAQKQSKTGKPFGADTALFRYLRDTLET